MSQPTLTIRLRLSTIPSFKRKKLTYSPYSPYSSIEHKDDNNRDIEPINNNNSSGSHSNCSDSNMNNTMKESDHHNVIKTKNINKKKKKHSKKTSKQSIVTWRSEKMEKTKLLLQKNKT